MDQDRFVVRDAVWAKIASLLPGRATDLGATGKDNRLSAHQKASGAKGQSWWIEVGFLVRYQPSDILL